MIPKDLLKDLGWNDALISALEQADPVQSPVSDVATSLTDVVFEGAEGHAADVDVRAQPPVGSPTLRLELED